MKSRDSALTQQLKYGTLHKLIQAHLFVIRHQATCLQSSLWSCTFDVLCLLTEVHPVAVCLSLPSWFGLVALLVWEPEAGDQCLQLRFPPEFVLGFRPRLPFG